MSEECREQRPLLCEEVSEDEEPEYSRRRFRLPLRGRAKASVKGAAAIINRWPDHWSSALSYWWMGLGMMALITFVVYNSLIAFAFLPISAHAKRYSPQKMPESLIQTSAFPEVYMHVFTDSDQEVDLTKYLPYINIVSDKYLDFNFNLIIVLNDTVSADNAISAEQNNLVAFNSIWSKDRFYRKSYHLRKNVKLIHKTLTQYLELLPLSVDWRKISPQFIPFLVKAFAIWDFGGISINPDILTPRSPHVTYIDKIYNILNKYTAVKEDNLKDEKPRKEGRTKKGNKRVKEFKRLNNIQDIIENFQSDSEINNDSYVENLTEAENKNYIVSNNGRKLMSTFLFKPKNKTNTNTIKSVNNKTESFDLKYKHNTDQRHRGESNEDSELSNANKLSILPLFLELLFRDKNDFEIIKPEEPKIVNNVVRRRKHTVDVDKIREKTSSIINTSSNNNTEATTIAAYKPMIVNMKYSTTVPETSKISNPIPTADTKKTDDELTIDLKGNILATKVSCHAFIGSIFNNVVHHKPEETVQEFIIKELSLFCKGVLSSCNGIEVILL